MDFYQNSKKIVIICFLFLVICLLIFWQGIYLLDKPGSLESKVFVIEKGEGSKEISINLKKQDLVKSGFLFRIYVLTFGMAGKLQAGEYELSPAMNVPEIAKKFSSGDVIREEVTIIEGWNLRDIGYRLEERGMFQAEELFELAGFPLTGYSKIKDISLQKDFSGDFDYLKDKPKNAGLEGYLFPDTYEIRKGESLEEIVKKMLNNFDKKLTPDLREEIKNQGKSIFEIVIMASLIEKEVQTLEDKKLASGIFWKRLKNNMPLQADATLSYITGKKTTRISIEETKIDSSYNTYKYRGLPLGPISNPGLESIIAALYPKDSKYWYYLSTLKGETIFSETLEKHNSAKAEHLKPR